MTEPKVSRPQNPAIYFEQRPLPWSWASQRLTRARNYWIATTLPDGRPHSRPVWGVWLDDTLYFSTGSRIGANLTRSPEITVHLESGDEVVIIEGVAETISDPLLTKRICDVYNPKYQWDMEFLFLAVHPRVVYGWLCDNSGEDRGAIFGQTATRWTFDDA